MVYALHNKKNEKILTVASLSESTISIAFKNPNFYGVFFFTEAACDLTIDLQQIQIKNQGLLFNNFFNDFLLNCSEEEFETLYNFQNQIKKELLKKEVGTLDMVSSHLKMLLINAVRVKKKEQEEAATKKDNLYYQIEKLIDANFVSETSPEFYCAALDVSLATFNRLCKKYFQNSFVTILNLKKIAVAKNKLFLTNTPIKEISYQVGFNDPLYFSRVNWKL